MKKRTTTLILAGLAVATAAFATPRGATVFQRTYQIKPGAQLASKPCWACHVGQSTTVKSLNVYGKAQQRKMRAKKTTSLTPEILRSLDKVDSDGDGYSNLAEIRADTSPGEKTSRPRRKAPDRK